MRPPAWIGGWRGPEAELGSLGKGCGQPGEFDHRTVTEAGGRRGQVSYMDEEGWEGLEGRQSCRRARGNTPSWNQVGRVGLMGVVLLPQGNLRTCSLESSLSATGVSSGKGES